MEDPKQLAGPMMRFEYQQKFEAQEAENAKLRSELQSMVVQLALKPKDIPGASDSTMNWKLFNAISQMSHWLGGAFASLALFTLFSLRGLYLSFGAVLLAAAIKEFWFDYKYESTEVRGSSLEDFLFYVLGLTIGGSVVWISRL